MSCVVPGSLRGGYVPGVPSSVLTCFALLFNVSTLPVLQTFEWFLTVLCGVMHVLPFQLSCR